MEPKTQTSSSFRLRSSPSLNKLRLRRTFDLFDTNSDGILTLQELNQALTRLGLHNSDLPSMITSHIKPGLTGLQFDDFHSLHNDLDNVLFSSGADVVVDEDAELYEAFKVFDEDKDGYISAMELSKVLEKLGLVEESGKVEMMICKVDRDGDGVVDFCEFKDMMRAIDVQSG